MNKEMAGRDGQSAIDLVFGANMCRKEMPGRGLVSSLEVLTKPLCERSGVWRKHGIRRTLGASRLFQVPYVSICTSVLVNAYVSRE